MSGCHICSKCSLLLDSRHHSDTAFYQTEGIDSFYQCESLVALDLQQLLVNQLVTGRRIAASVCWYRIQVFCIATSVDKQREPTVHHFLDLTDMLVFWFILSSSHVS